MFRHPAPWLAALALALPLPAAADPTADPTADLDALGWLAGCWQGQGGGGKNQECWTSPEGGLMLAVSRVISEQGATFEFLHIAPHGEGLALFASPGGRPAVAFPLVESGQRVAVFANPGHDFPQRITYRRDGDALAARVEAQRDGEWRGFDVAWKRVPGAAPGGWPGAPESSSEDLARQVREVEAAFARTMADRDHEAFTAFLAPDTIFVSAATARGREQVATQWKGYFTGPQAPFSWQPETVEVLASGTLALSTGPVRDPSGQLISRFTSVWRRQAPGEWRIVFDKGERICPVDASTPRPAAAGQPDGGEQGPPRRRVPEEEP